MTITSTGLKGFIILVASLGTKVSVDFPGARFALEKKSESMLLSSFSFIDDLDVVGYIDLIQEK